MGMSADTATAATATAAAVTAAVIVLKWMDPPFCYGFHYYCSSSYLEYKPVICLPNDASNHDCLVDNPMKEW